MLEAYRAGCDDYVDRRRDAASLASHIRSYLLSRQTGFQPTQMLAAADTDLTGSLSHLDLPGVIQMLGQAHQTGALHINAGATDGIIFFEGGEIAHAECGSFFGDEAVKYTAFSRGTRDRSRKCDVALAGRIDARGPRP